MIPASGRAFAESIIVTDDKRAFTARTYRMDLESKEIAGFCDGIEACNQAIFLALSIERYKYPIFSDNYGCELEKCIGMKIPLVYRYIERYIREALSVIPFIESLSDFVFENPSPDVVVCKFKYKSRFGESLYTKVVAV